VEEDESQDQKKEFDFQKGIDYHCGEVRERRGRRRPRRIRRGIITSGRSVGAKEAE